MTEDLLWQTASAYRTVRAISTKDHWDFYPRCIAEGAFTLLLIHLRDMLINLDKLGRRIDFRDDVRDGDITDLAVRMRNAACHMTSGNRQAAPRVTGVYSVYVGKGSMSYVAGIPFECPYEDDVAVFYGKDRMFIRRHVLRCLDEAAVVIEGTAAENGWRFGAPLDIFI